MASKRDISDLDEGEVTEPEIKRKKKNYHSGGTRQHQNSSIDPTWGQKYVFSGYGDATTIPAGEESDFEDDAEAMAYLMSVRQEASDIPHLLVAPKVQIGPQLPPELTQDDGDDNADGDHDGDYEYDGDGDIDRTIYTDGTGDTRGYYEDGAYVSLPGPGEGEEEEEEGYDEPGELTEKAIHEAYFAAVLEKYSNLRDLLNSTRPSDAYSRLPPSTATEAAPFGRNSSTMSKWSGLIHKTDPLPLQIALISKDSALRILRVILSGKFLRQGQPVSERTSRWLWALLARLPERGEMNHVEIGWIRDLGRRAVLLGRSLAEMAALREELEDGGLGVHEYVDGSSDEDDMVEDPKANDGVDSPMNGDGTPDFPADDPKKADSAPESAPAAAADQAEERKQTDGQDDDLEEGEISEEDDNHGKGSGEDEDDEDVAMEIASNSSTDPDDLEAAKARLLAQVDEAEAENDQLSAEEAARYRARMNMRATVNMILTVAGEFYGQRDLLEFREPFVGM
ncbi:unnamed protein product [Clonostachys solani]|uniref:V-snare n=1 Tax=Clonostachys solani TaxID=160281 RepID=A0A9N9W0U1_9HYPO|nr:unnamed protein product [Clonostachys solani]